MFFSVDNSFSNESSINEQSLDAIYFDPSDTVNLQPSTNHHHQQPTNHESQIINHNLPNQPQNESGII
jgi:hypothetical protein